tara:strand:- start:131 stop:574 length:444 start_codon:yes stop_codon:yes gene_type:complete
MKGYSKPRASIATARWRRLVLGLAVLAIILVLWVRDRQIQSGRDEVLNATIALLEDVATGTDRQTGDPARALILETAWQEIGRLRNPIPSEASGIEDDEDPSTAVVVRGEAGGAIRLRWRGRPPILVGVEKLDYDAVFAEPMDGGNR